VKKPPLSHNPFRKVGGYLLDKFSQIDLRRWKKASDDLEHYHVRLFYHLEALREIHSEELCDALQKHRTHKQVGTSWYRLVDYRYSNEPLSTKGSLINGGRFNIGSNLNPRIFPNFPALYIAETYETAYTEYFGAPEKVPVGKFKGHELSLARPKSFAAVSLSYELKNVFNLSKLSNLNTFTKVISKFKMPDDLKELGRSIGIRPPWLVSTAALLKGSLLDPNWRSYPVQYEIPSNPQVFGRLLRDAGLEGVLFPSTKGKAKCLAIFTENLDSTSSFVELKDAAPAGVLHTRLDSTSLDSLSTL